MTDQPENLVYTAEDHLSWHERDAKINNNLVIGPFDIAHNTPNIDTGVTLFTPKIGDRIVGLFVKTTEAWDVADEKFGLGISGTTDADLAFQFPALSLLPPASPSFPRGRGFGVPWGGEVVEITSSVPLLIRTLTGGNTSGSMQLWLHVLTADLF